MPIQALFESKYLVKTERYDSDKYSDIKPIESLINTNDIGNTLMVIRHEDLNNSRYCVYNINDIVKEGKPPGSFCHEVIYGDRPQKLRFDIDANINISHCTNSKEVLAEGIIQEDKIIDEMLDAIIRVWNQKYFAYTGLLLSEENIMIMSSSGFDYSPKDTYKYKVSLHILVAPKHFVVANNREAEAFATLVGEQLPEYIRLYLDNGIYKSKNNLRMLYSYKTPQNITQKIIRQKLLKNKDNDYTFTDSLITYVNGLSVLELQLSKNFVDVEMDKLVQLETSQALIIKNLLTEEEQNTFMIRDITRNIVNFNRLKPSYCEFCDVIHEKDNTLYLMCNTKGSKINVVKKCRRSTKSKLIGNIDQEGSTDIYINTLINDDDDLSIVEKFKDKSKVLSCIDDMCNIHKIKEDEKKQKCYKKQNIDEIDANDFDKLFVDELRDEYENENNCIHEDINPKLRVIPKPLKFGSDLVKVDLYDGLSDDVFNDDYVLNVKELYDNQKIEMNKEISDTWSSLTSEERNKLELHNIKTNCYVSQRDEDLFDKWPNKCSYSESIMRPFVEPGSEVPRTICVKAPMKMGKTKMLREFIKDHFSNPDCVIRILTFRRTFASHMHQRFSDLGFTIYDATVGKITDKRLIIQLESLHRLEIHHTDLVVLDESELIIEQINSNLYHSFTRSFAALDYLIKQSKHLICMDAYMSDRTYRVLDTMRKFYKDDMLFHVNTFKRDLGDKYIMAKNIGDWLQYLMSSINDGDNVAIMTNSLEECKTVEQHIRNSVNFPINIGVYSSETSKSVKNKAFNDVDNIWSKHNVLILTPTVSAGVSFEVEHFDKVFGFFIDTSCPVESCIQMLGRVRNVKSREYTILINYNIRNLPTNIKELKKRIQQQHMYLMSEINNSRLDFTYDADGNVEIRNTDYMQIWLENQRIKNLSKNNFLSRFISLISKYGADISELELDMEDINSIKLLVKEHKSTKHIIKDKEATNISSAASISFDQYINIKNALNDTTSEAKEVTKDELYSYKKFNFKQFYGITNRSNFTGEDYLHFNVDYIKQHFINLNIINLLKKYDVDNLFKAIKLREQQYLSGIDLQIDLYHTEALDVYGKNINKRKDLKNSFRDHMILNFKNNSIVHEVSHKLVTICGWNNVLDIDNKIPSTSVMIGLKNNKEYLKGSISIISSILDKQWDIPDETQETYFNDCVKCINQVIKYTYGISIVKDKAVSNHGVNVMLRLKSGFVYESKYDKYLIPGLEYSGNSKDVRLINLLTTTIEDINNPVEYTDINLNK